VLTIINKLCSSKVVFNVISFPTNLIIIGLSWFISHNLKMNWKTRTLHFELVNKTRPKYKAFPTSMLDSKHDSHMKTHQQLVNACKNSNVKDILKVIKDPNI